MSRRTTVSLSTVIMILDIVSPRAVSTCTCVYSTPKEKFARSAAVFLGSVQSAASDTTSAIIGDREHVFELKKYTFDVKGVWKGELGSRVDVITQATGPMCGSKFDRNVDYVVYAREHQGRLSTGSCSENPPVSAAIFDLYSLGLPAVRDTTISLNPIGVEELFVIALSDNGRARGSALRALGKSVVDRELIELRLLEMLNGDETDERLVALETFRLMGPDGVSATDGLLNAFHSDVEEVRLQAFNALIAVIGRRNCFPYLMTAIKDDSYDLKVCALRETSCMRGCISPDEQQTLYQELLGLIEHPDENIQCLAISGLFACGAASVDALPILDYKANSNETYRVRKTAEHTAEQIRRAYIEEGR